MVKKSGMISGYEDIDACGTRIASPAFVRDLQGIFGDPAALHGPDIVLAEGFFTKRPVSR